MQACWGKEWARFKLHGNVSPVPDVSPPCACGIYYTIHRVLGSCTLMRVLGDLLHPSRVLHSQTRSVTRFQHPFETDINKQASGTEIAD